MFHNRGSGLDSMNLLASLAKVWGKSSTAGVHSIHMDPSSYTPASPAVLPSGTVKDTQKPFREAIGIATVGCTP